METYTETWEYCDGEPNIAGFYQFEHRGGRCGAVVKLENYDTFSPAPHIAPKQRLVAMVEGFTDRGFLPLHRLPKGRWARRVAEGKPKPKPYMGFRRLSHPPTKPGLYFQRSNDGEETTYMVTDGGYVTFINTQGSTGSGRIEAGFDQVEESAWYELTRDVCHDQLPDFSYSTWTQLNQYPGDKPGTYLFVGENDSADLIQCTLAMHEKEDLAYYSYLTTTKNPHLFLDVEQLKLWKGTWYAFDPAGALEMDELMRAQSSEVLDMPPLLGWHLTYEEVVIQSDNTECGSYIMIEPGQLPRQISVRHSATPNWLDASMFCWCDGDCGKGQCSREQHRIKDLPLGARFFRLKVVEEYAEVVEEYAAADPSAGPESGWCHALSHYRMGFRNAVMCLPEGLTDEFYKFGYEAARRIASFNGLNDDVVLKRIIQQRLSAVRKT